MKPYFSTRERVESLWRSAEAWVGTPFVPNACIRGGGVSCQKLAGGIYVDCGHFDQSVSIPDADMRWGQAHKESESLIVQFIEEGPVKGKFAIADRMSMIPGDLIGIKIGGCIHHLGVVVDIVTKKFIHCERSNGTHFSRFDDATFWKRIDRVWRPVE